MAALGLFAAIASLIAISGPAGDAEAQTVARVKAIDSFFKPARITVSRGTTVRWKNAGQLSHNVKGTGFASKTLAPGATYSRRFSKAGTFAYVCTFHAGMKGQVVVK